MLSSTSSGRLTDRSDLLGRILDNVESTILVVGRESRIAYFNRAAVQFLSHTFSISPELGASVSDLFAAFPLECEHLRALFHETFAKGNSRSSGFQPVGIEAVSYRMTDPESQTDYAVISFQDRHSPAGSRMSERFQELAESIPHLVWSARGDGCVDYCNRYWTDYVGLCFEDVQGHGWMQSLHSDDRENARLAWKTALANRTPYDVTYRLRRHDGIYRWFKARGTPVVRRDEQGVRWFGTSTDIHDQITTEAALRESETRFRQLADSLPQIVYTVGANGEYTYINARGLEIIGLSLEKALEPGKWEERIHPEDRPVSQAAWERATTTASIFEAEYRLLDAKTGEYRLYLARAVPVRDGANSVVQWFGAATDINDQRRSEELLHHKHKLESIGLLAGGIAHDFNNLLVGVLGAASCARGMIDEEHPSVFLLDLILKSGDRASQLTRQLLAYAGKGTFIVKLCDISVFIADAYDLLRMSVAREIELNLDLAPDLPMVEVDVSQLHQVAMNLVINAAEAIESRPKKRIQIRTFEAALSASEIRKFSFEEPAPGYYVVLEVSDSGCGMDEQTKSRIFDPFFTTKFTGRGLGLAAVGGIVRVAGGTINVVSRVGEGTTFRVYFPVSPKAYSDLPVSSGVGRSKSAGRILVVDDEPSVLTVASAALRLKGYESAVYSTAASALQAFRDSPGSIQAAVIDLSMPGIPGEELILRLRDVRPDLPVVVSSGHGEKDVFEKVKSFEKVQLLPKPYTSGQLLETIQWLLDS